MMSLLITLLSFILFCWIVADGNPIAIAVSTALFVLTLAYVTPKGFLP